MKRCAPPGEWFGPVALIEVWARALAVLCAASCNVEPRLDSWSDAIERDAGASRPQEPAHHHGEAGRQATIIITPNTHGARTRPPVIVKPPVIAAAVCGDGRLDAREPCDPSVEPCCAADCSGVAPAGTVCREAKTLCDAAETCDGESLDCPPDAALADGAPCNDGLGRCSLETCCPGVTTAVSPRGRCSLGDPKQIVFVTSTSYAGDFGFANADALCTEVAHGANLEGTFRAWLSWHDAAGTRISAFNRVGGSDYRRVDGVAVAKSTDEILSGYPLTAPIELTEWGVQRDSEVWTGTNNGSHRSGGTSDYTCGDWTSDSSDVMGTIGDSSATNYAWTGGVEQRCDALLPLYCFPDLDGFVFVTSSTIALEVAGGLTLATADQFCNDAARQGQEVGAVPLGATFTAWLSDGQTDARSRIIDRAYYRGDGLRVATSLADLTDGTLENPITLDEAGDPHSATLSPAVWTGSDVTGNANGACNNWTPDGAEAGTQGDATMSNAAWTDTGRLVECSGEGRLYCFQNN